MSANPPCRVTLLLALLAWACPAGSQTARQAPPEEPQKGQTAWPGERRDLVFAWRSGRAANRVTDAGGGLVRHCRVVPHGRARWGPAWQMRLHDGWFDPEQIDKPLLTACRRTGGLTVEAVIEPAGLDQDGPARIVTFSGGNAKRNFLLGQSGPDLIFYLRTTSTEAKGAGAQLTLCRLEDEKPRHVVVSFADGTITAHVDGKRVLRRRLGGSLANWEPMRVRFGGEIDGRGNWNGYLEAVGLYARAVSADQVATKYKLLARDLAARRPIPRIELTAKLQAATAVPSPEMLGNYTRGLVVHTWQVRTVHAGKLDDRRIQVAHWAVLDSKVVGEIRRLQPGAVRRLVVEPTGQKYHPELESERRFNDSTAYGLPLFVEVGPPGQAEGQEE